MVRNETFCYIFLTFFLGDAQFVSATYRLFKPPCDKSLDTGSTVTYKGNNVKEIQLVPLSVTAQVILKCRLISVAQVKVI